MRNVLSRKSGKQKCKVRRGVVHLLTANGKHKSYRTKTFCEVGKLCTFQKGLQGKTEQIYSSPFQFSVVSQKVCHKHTRLNTCLPPRKTTQTLRHRKLSAFQCVPSQYDCVVSPCPTQVPSQCLPLLGQFHKDPSFCLLSAL